MSRGIRRAAGAVLLGLLLGDPCAQAQLPPEVPPPPVPLAEPLAECVPRHGEGGCAARLYAEALCAMVGFGAEPLPWQRWLEQRYREAEIRFEGLTVAEIERRAVMEQAPQLCPAHAEAIRNLFLGRLQP